MSETFSSVLNVILSLIIGSISGYATPDFLQQAKSEKSTV